MKELWEIIMCSDEYFLGRIHENASRQELEEIIRLKIKRNKN